MAWWMTDLAQGCTDDEQMLQIVLGLKEVKGT